MSLSNNPFAYIALGPDSTPEVRATAGVPTVARLAFGLRDGFTPEEKAAIADSIWAQRIIAGAWAEDGPEEHFIEEFHRGDLTFAGALFQCGRRDSELLARLRSKLLRNIARAKDGARASARIFAARTSAAIVSLPEETDYLAAAGFSRSAPDRVHRKLITRLEPGDGFEILFWYQEPLELVVEVVLAQRPTDDLLRGELAGLGDVGLPSLFEIRGFRKESDGGWCGEGTLDLDGASSDVAAGVADERTLEQQLAVLRDAEPDDETRFHAGLALARLAEHSDAREAVRALLADDELPAYWRHRLALEVFNHATDPELRGEMRTVLEANPLVEGLQKLLANQSVILVG